MTIYGVDFTCAPRKAKPITVASASLRGKVLEIREIEQLASFAAFEAFLARPGPWIGGFDFPFSLPAELVRDLAWPEDWAALVAHCAAIDRPGFRSILDEYRNARPVGTKYAHRATDIPAGSSSPMKLVNPPVALMFHEGARRLLHADVSIPLLRESSSSRIALEAYPGLLVRRQLGLRASYKSDTRAEQTPARREIRRKILYALRAGEPLKIRVDLPGKLQNALLAEGSGDLLDAVICATQAAWAAGRASYGLPAQTPAGEGWIVTS